MNASSENISKDWDFQVQSPFHHTGYTLSSDHELPKYMCLKGAKAQTYWGVFYIPQKQFCIQINKYKPSIHTFLSFPDSSVGNESTCNAGDPISIPGLGRSAGEGISYSSIPGLPLWLSWRIHLQCGLIPGSTLDWEDPLEKGKATHSSMLAWKIGQRSLAGYSPWGHKELDTTERLSTQYVYP